MKMQKDYEFDLFMETSAKTGFNAEELFVEAGKILFEEKNKLEKQRNDSEKDLGIKLSEQKNEKNKEKKCCFC